MYSVVLYFMKNNQHFRIREGEYMIESGASKEMDHIIRELHEHDQCSCMCQCESFEPSRLTQ